MANIGIVLNCVLMTQTPGRTKNFFSVKNMNWGRRETEAAEDRNQEQVNVLHMEVVC